MLSNEYTEDCLQELSKSQLIVLGQRGEIKATIKSLTDKVKAMNTNFKKDEPMLVLLKQPTIL